MSAPGRRKGEYGSAPQGRAAGNAALDVEARLVQIAYDRLLPSLGMTLGVTTVFLTLLWGVFSPTTRMVWVGALVGSVLVRFALWLAYRHATRVADSLPLWQHLFSAGALLAGLAWSSGPVLVILSGSDAELALFAGTLLSVCAVAMTTQAAQREAMQAFVVAALAPVAMALWWSGGESDRLVGLVLFAGMISLLLVGGRSSAAIRALLEAQLKLRASVADADGARAQAEAASLAKTRFLANMSHELRTPLNAVIGAAQLLRIGQGGGERDTQLVDAIQRGGTHLLGVIEGILDLSRIEAGEMTLQSEDFHLVECIEAAVSTAAVPAAAKGLRLACIVAPELPAWRHGDANRLRQVVLNLLGNAVKFTDRGEIVVQVRPGATLHDVRVSVTDTGVGITPASIEHIFEPFRQAEENADRRFGGSGLGLAIVRQLVDAMGGRVGATSEPGRGSCFEFELPLPPAQQQPRDAPPLRHRVAVLEPHAPSAQALQAQLQRLGCDVERFSGAAAMRPWIAASTAPTWVLAAAEVADQLDQVLDLIAPERVIVMSGDVSYSAELAREEFRLSRQLTQPVTRSALVSRIAAPPDSTPSAAPDRRPDVLRGTPASMPTTHVLLVEDDALNRTIVAGMLEHAGHRVHIAEDGAKALERLPQLARVDVVLMDWQMPGMDGLEVTRRMRGGAAGPVGASVPIIGLTANAFAEDRARCLAAGMDDFLTKPVLSKTLLATVARWSHGHRTAAAAAAGAGAAAATEAPPPAVFDPSVLAALPMVVDGSAPEFAHEALAMFIDSTEATLQGVERALAGADAMALQRLVHTLKSGSSSVGALELAALAMAHEERLRRGEPPDAELAPLLVAALRRLRRAVHGAQAAALPAEGQLT